MAIQFNNYARLSSLFSKMYSSMGTSTVRIYPSTVPFPTTTITSTAPAGYILTIPAVTFSVAVNAAAGTGKFSMNNIPDTAAPTANGTAAWAHISDGTDAIATDSIGITGSLNIVTLDTLNLVTGTQYQLRGIVIGAA